MLTYLYVHCKFTYLNWISLINCARTQTIQDTHVTLYKRIPCIFYIHCVICKYVLLDTTKYVIHKNCINHTLLMMLQYKIKLLSICKTKYKQYISIIAKHCKQLPHTHAYTYSYTPKTHNMNILFSLERYRKSVISTPHIKKHHLHVSVYCRNSFFDWYLSHICIIYEDIYSIYIKILHIITSYMTHIIDTYQSNDEFSQGYKTYKL